MDRGQETVQVIQVLFVCGPGLEAPTHTNMYVRRIYD